MIEKKPLERVVGRFSAGAEGPTLIALGGLHGNEPAGLVAIERFLDMLRKNEVPIRGEFIGLAGNRKALQSGVRFEQNDLNRMWLPDKIRRLRSGIDGEIPGPEDLELLELDDTLNGIFERVGGDVIFVDLHTSSADGVPFAFIGDTLRSRKVAFHIPFPVILGLEEQLDGGLTEYLCNRGCITVGIEAGQHEKLRSVDVAEGALWVIATAIGMADREDIPGFAERRAFFRKLAEELPPVLEVRYRYGIARRKDFTMKPGYVSFQKVRKGEVLADDGGRRIKAGESGRVILPLYQPLGTDGFFLAREFSPFWLAVSSMLRRIHVDRIIHWLPGVHKAKLQKGVLLVSPAVARWFVPQIFHLLGYRKLRRGEHYWVLSRRRYDLRSPVRIEASL